jgi:hypothetical protein
MIAGSLSLGRVHRINPNTTETFFNMLEKVATKNNLSDAPGNVSNNVESFIKTNNRTDSVKLEKSSKILTHGRKE